MGGDVFKNSSPGGPTIKTPRMSPEIYYRLRELYMPKLQEYYEKVLVPVACPWKTSHGDIDFLVEGPRTPQQLRQVIDSFDPLAMVSHNPLQISMAVAQGSGSDNSAQIDVKECAAGSVEWQAFLHAYGDLWSILGAVARQTGLKATDKGLHVRISEAEKALYMEVDGKQNPAAITTGETIVWLSQDMEEVMEFLGLSSKRYYQSFKTEEELFQWIATCNLICEEAIENRRLIAADRQRNAKRHMFRKFIEEWLPNRLGMPLAGKSASASTLYILGLPQEVASSTPPSELEDHTDVETAHGPTVTPSESLYHTPPKLREMRERTVQRALNVFNKRAEYDTKLTAATTKRKDFEAKQILFGVLKKQSGLADLKVREMLRSLRRWVDFDGPEPKFLSKCHVGNENARFANLVESDGSLKQGVVEWVRGHWMDARQRERDYKNAKAEVAKMKA